jgi:hypothetical protein
MSLRLPMLIFQRKNIRQIYNYKMKIYCHKGNNSTLDQSQNENNGIQGGNFSFTPSQKEIYPLSSQNFNEVEQNLKLILSHFQEPLFPRNIMTKALG